MNQYQILGHCLPDKLLTSNGKRLFIKDHVFELKNHIILIWDIPDIASKTIDIYQLMVKLMKNHDYQESDLMIKNYPQLATCLNDYDHINYLHHILYEKQRLDDAIKALTDYNVPDLGHLINQSYVSYKTMVGLTKQKHDRLVLLANQLGAIGANIDGSKILILVDINQSKSFSQTFEHQYQKLYKGRLEKL